MKHIITRFCSLLLAACLAIGLTSGTPMCAAEEQEGQGEPLTSGNYGYTLADGQATIIWYNGNEAELEIPDTLDGHPVTGIGFAAFECRDGITRVTIPDSVTSIGDSAFWGCAGLPGITIPAGVTSIGDNPFASCGLTHIDVSPANPAYAQYDGILFDKQGQTLVAYPAAREGGYVIPEGVLRIANAAFEGCAGLTGIAIPDSVTVLGDEAFRNCPGLSAVTIPDSITRISSHAFDGCAGLARVVIPNSVTGIGDCAFYNCDGLPGLPLPDSVTDIGFYAFAGCGGLTDMVIPKGVPYLDEGVFYWCVGLIGVTLPDAMTGIEDYAFYQCGKLSNITIPANVASIGNYAFAECTGLTALAIPGNVTSIGESAFAGCRNLTLTVKRGGYAENYARENGIPYTHAEALGNPPKDADALRIGQIDEFLSLSGEEIIAKLGPGFEAVAAGPEGAMDGYCYEALGMTFAFYPDSVMPDLIECGPGFRISGVGVGSLFSEILEALGDAEITETWLELPDYTVYLIDYQLGNGIYSFIAFEKDGPADMLWISPKW